MRGIMLVLALAGCSAAPGAVGHPGSPSAAHASLSLAADDRMIAIPAGRYISGSTLEERAAAYDAYQESAGDDTARAEKWFEHEADRHSGELPAFRIDLMPVTQAQFAELVIAGRVTPPAIDDAGWRAQGRSQDFATQVARFVWSGKRPPDGREDHPVVLVSWSDADRYCAWRGALRGEKRRLPTAQELEKVARGEDGLAYPWGNSFEPDRLNSAVKGSGDTMPVGSYASGASPYGVLDLAGNVFQWTATPDGDQMVVKGSAWDSPPGVGRGASLDRRPRAARDVVVGFRCAADGP
jgi:formylglycine-generating enzyme required for sulfatase activity